MMWLVAGMIAAVGAGVWVGIGMPGVRGREDRVLPPGHRRRRLEKNYIHWLKPRR